MAVPHDLALSLLVGNGIPVSATDGVERVRVDLAPAYDFQRADGAVNWAVIATKYTDESALTFDNLEDTDSDGNPVVWQIRVTFLGRGDKVVGGGNSVTFEIPTSAGATVNFPEDVNLVDPVENPEYGPTWAAQAEASALAAAASAAAAVAVGTTNDTIIAGRINTPGSATATALSNTYAQVWKPLTAYTIGDRVVSPGGDVVRAAANHTSGASYDATKWAVSTSFVTPAQQSAALVPATGPLKPMVNVSFGGDSNTAYNGGSNWTAMLSAASYGRARRVSVIATGGINIQTWASVQLPTVLAETGRNKVQLLVLMLGTNNVGEELVATRAAYEAILDACAAAGILVAVCTIAPRMDSAASKAWAQQWNGVLAQIAYERDLPLLDAYSALADPATGDFKAGYYPAGETIHFFTVAGQMAVARALRTAFLNIISRVHPRFAKANTSADNLAPNALMMTGGGKFNGVNNVAGYAQGWQSNAGLTIASGAPSLYTDAAGLTWQRFKDVDTTLILSQTWINIAPGHRYEVLLKLRALGFTGADASTYTVDVAYVNAATVKAGLVGYQPPIANESPASPTDETDYLVSRFEGVAPSDALQIRVTVTITKGAGTLVGKTVDYTGLTVTDLTKAERTLTDAVTTAGSANLTSAKAAFTSADIGKTINVYGAGTGGTILTTTIASVTSATVAVMATPAVVAVPVARLMIAPVV